MIKFNSPQLFQSKPECVLLDLDNTLYEYEEPHLHALSLVKEKVIKNPCFSTLLFFDFFKKMDLLTQIDTYRLLKLKIE